MPKMAWKAPKIDEAWNPVCCHGYKLLSCYCGAHLVEYCYEESNISDTNWLRYLSSYLMNI